MPWVIQADAYSTEGRLRVDPNPFVEKQTDVDLLSLTPVRNQLIVRGAKVLSPILQTTGAGLVGASYVMPTERNVMYLLATKKQAKTTMFRDNGTYKSAYKINRSRSRRGNYKTIYRKRGMYSDAKFFARNPPIGVKIKITDPAKVVAAKTTRTSGAAMILGGRVLPVMAYGYIGYSILFGDGEAVPDDPMSRTYFGAAADLIQATPDLIDAFQRDQTQVLTLGGQIGGAAIDYAQGVAARAIGFALLQGVFG